MEEESSLTDPLAAQPSEVDQEVSSEAQNILAIPADLPGRAGVVG